MQARCNTAAGTAPPSVPPPGKYHLFTHAGNRSHRYFVWYRSDIAKMQNCPHTAMGFLLVIIVQYCFTNFL